MLISFIVPVYNVREYLASCLESIKKSKSNWEIIIIHDPDVDNSFVGNENYLSDDRIRILERKNEGLSVARNQGAAVSRGEYLYFIDSDDMIFAENIDIILEYICYSKPDIVVGDFISDGRKYDYCKLSQNSFEMNGSDYFVNYYQQTTSMVWRYLIKSSYYHEILGGFHPLKYVEDIEFTPRAFMFASKVLYYPLDIYYYRYREDSLSNTISRKRFFDCITTVKLLYSNVPKAPNRRCETMLYKISNNLFFKTIIKYPLSDNDERMVEEIMLNLKPANFMQTLLFPLRIISKGLFLSIVYLYYTRKNK